jgi:hypothetical protein
MEEAARETHDNVIGREASLCRWRNTRVGYRLPHAPIEEI